jgi:ribonuclease BN (tRNA processing enzyme)
MPEIIVMGSSSGDPSPDRANASIIIKQGEKLYQFDAGEGCAAAMKRHGIDHAAIGTIIISHMHPDHIAGLFLEIQMMYLAKRREPLTVYLPSEAVAAVEIFMKATYLFAEKMGFEMRLRPVTSDPVFRDDDITVYARANTHLEKYAGIVDRTGAPNKMQSYSYVIKTTDAKIIYSGDVGSVDDYADLLPGCTALITEGLHVDQESLFEKVVANNVGHLILTHLSDDMYRNPEPILASAQKHGVRGLYIAADGMVLSV